MTASLLSRMRSTGDSHLFRLACLGCALFLITGLFWIGSKPVAVGLFHPPLDKVAHFATFGMIACMLWFSILRGRPWLLIAAVTLVGAADEIHQQLLPGRTAGLDDLAVDVLAAAVIASLLEYARRRNW
ncbi:MAG: VanZ family protein [Gammaproteobacteria bacterium]|nr:VanZ family protein [Gammaproteobacteria bacterium]